MKKLMLLFLLLIFCLPVFASNWVQIGKKHWIDLEHRVKQNDIVTIWAKRLSKDKNDKIGDKSYWYILSNTTYNCSTMKSKINSFYVYDYNDDVIESFNEQDIKSIGRNIWTNIVPDSVQYYEFKAACRNY